MSDYLDIEGMKRANVWIEDYYGPYPALVSRQHWNGWSMPAFTREVTERIVADMTAINAQTEERYRTVFTWDGDVLVVDQNEDRGQEWYESERYPPDAHGLYGLGAGSWVWEDDTDCVCALCAKHLTPATLSPWVWVDDDGYETCIGGTEHQLS